MVWVVEEGRFLKVVCSRKVAVVVVDVAAVVDTGAAARTEPASVAAVEK